MGSFKHRTVLHLVGKGRLNHKICYYLLLYISKGFSENTRQLKNRIFSKFIVHIIAMQNVYFVIWRKKHWYEFEKTVKIVLPFIVLTVLKKMYIWALSWMKSFNWKCQVHKILYELLLGLRKIYFLHQFCLMTNLRANLKRTHNSTTSKNKNDRAVLVRPIMHV